MDIIDTGEKKESQCDFETVWICSGGTNGVTEKEWVASAIGGVNQGGAQNETIDVPFSLLDDCGLLQHPNAFDTERTLTSPVTTQVNTGTPPSNNDPDQHQLDFYIKTRDAAGLILKSNGFHSGAIAIGTCLGKLKESYRYIRTDFTTPDAQGGSIAAGIYKIRTWVHDPGQNGGHTVQWDINGDGVYTNIPTDLLYTIPPKIEETKAYHEKETGKWFRADDKTEITDEVWCSNPCKGDFDVVVQEPLAVKDIKEADPLLLCDKLADGSEVTFIRHFPYIDGVLQPTVDTDLEGQPYTVQGDVVPCNPQCDLLDVWLCDSTTGVAGVTEEIWDASGVGGNSSSEPITVGFTKLDECGFPLHESPADTTQTLTSYQSTNINPNPPDNTPDQHTMESYVKLPSAVTLGLRAGGIHAGLFAIGPCNGKLKESFRYENSLSRTPVAYVAGAEIVHVKSWIHDPSQNGSHELEYSLNGGQTWSNIPDEWLFTTPPTVQKIKAYYNKTERKYYRADDLTEIVETATLQILCDDPCKGDVSVVVEQPLSVTVDKPTYVNLGSETVKFSDTNSGTLTVPSGATFATIQFQGECDSRFTVDGTAPTLTTGKIACVKRTLKLGCSPHFIGAVEDLAKFEAVASEANCTNIIEVCYYREA